MTAGATHQRELCDLSTGVCPRCGLDADARGITRDLRITCRSAIDGGHSDPVRACPAVGLARS